MDDFFPNEYLEAEVRASEAISSALSHLGWASGPASIPSAPWPATGFRSVLAPVPLSGPAPVSQRLKNGSRIDGFGCPQAVEESL